VQLFVEMSVLCNVNVHIHYFKVSPLSRVENSTLSMEPEDQFCVHKNPILSPILSQLNPVHTLTPCFFNVHFNIILPSRSK
jgi:hypothetical protein